MSIQDQLVDAMKAAMKAKEPLRLNTIRMARTALKNAEIETTDFLENKGVQCPKVNLWGGDFIFFK